MDNKEVSDRDLQSLALHCPLLEHVYLFYAKGFTPEGLSQFVRQASQLTTINISSVYNDMFKSQEWQEYLKLRSPQLKITY
jgi:hypothetical protein